MSFSEIPSTSYHDSVPAILQLHTPAPALYLSKSLGNVQIDVTAATCIAPESSVFLVSKAVHLTAHVSKYFGQIVPCSLRLPQLKTDCL
ncbi:hypothetical protein M3J09_012382 [Ascochyta lentis]